MNIERLSFAAAEQRLRALGPPPEVPEREWAHRLQSSRDLLFAVEIGLGVEKVLAGFALDRHITSELESAFRLQYPNLAAATSLEQHYEALLERGEESVSGFMRALRGKLFELRLPPVLEDEFPGFKFALSESATQAGWDLVGTNREGLQVLVQAKARASSAAGDVIERMEQTDAPRYFAATRELYEAIVEARPELGDRLIATDVSHLEIDEHAESALATMAEHLGIDVPDGIGELIPYIGEIVLGVRLVVDIVRNERSLRELPREDKNRLHGVRTLALMARFGVSTVMVTVGGAAGSTAGSLLPGAGTAIGGLAGSIGGAVSAGKVNKVLEPRLLDLGLSLAGLTKEDLFYWQNKLAVDAVGVRLVEQRVNAEKVLAPMAFV